MIYLGLPVAFLAGFVAGMWYFGSIILPRFFIGLFVEGKILRGPHWDSLGEPAAAGGKTSSELA